MKSKILITALIAASAQFIISCNKDDNDEYVIPPYTVPTTYNFSDVEYAEASARVSMWVGFTGILGRSNTRQLSQDTIDNLWNNANASFTAETANNIPHPFDALNALTFNLSSKVADAATFKSYADSMVEVSKSIGVAASQGVAGKIGSRIVNYKGVEFNQLVAKGLMGALTLNNVVAILNNIPNDDNTTVIPGKGTAMQHNWDLAFGYVGIPKDYDTSFNYTAAPVKADRPLAIGGYFWERARPIQAGGNVFSSFLKGRAAIAVKDYKVRDEAIATIKEYLEKTLAAAANIYLGLSQTRADNAARFHDYSEALGFVLALKYRAAGSKLTDADYQTLVSLLQTDFWDLAADASFTKVKQAQTILTTAYGTLQ